MCEAVLKRFQRVSAGGVGRQADRQRDKHANFTYSPLYTEQYVRHIEISLTMALKSVIAERVINLEVLSWTRNLAATQ